MAISYIGQATGTNTGTLPSHTTGDLIIVFAYRDGNTTAPTLPAGYTNIRNAGASSNSYRLGYKIAASGSETFGTWTNGTSVVAHVYRGADSTTPIGGSNASTNASTTVSYPTVTMAVTDGTSWVAGFAGHRSTNTNLQNAPTGMTNRATVVDATDEAAGHDTNGGVSSWSGTTVSVSGTSSGWYGVTVEIRAETVPTLSAQTVTLVSSTAGTPKVTTNKASGTAYMVCVPNGDSPSVAQIKAGQNSSSGAAIAADDQTVTASGLQTFSTVTGLTTGTPYDFWFVHNTAEGDSSVVKAVFTPLVPGSYDTGWLNPGSTPVSTAIGGALAMTNPGNVAASDNTYATKSATGSTGSIAVALAHNFSANIPQGATIDGIEARVEGKQSAANTDVVWNIGLAYDIPAMDSDGVSTTNETWSSTTAMTSTDSTFTTGSASEWPPSVWGSFTNNGGISYTYVPTVAQVNSSAFGMQTYIESTASVTTTLSIDHMQIKVYYTIPEPDSANALFWAFP